MAAISPPRTPAPRTTKLHIMSPDGSILVQEFTDSQLKYKCVPFEELRKLIGCDMVEHVTVLWRGARAHMFMDEDGYAFGKKANSRATRLYINNILSRQDMTKRYVYNDLTLPPELTTAEWTDIYRIAVGFNPIVGIACLWEGEME